MKKGRAVLTALLCSAAILAVGCGKKDADYTWNAKESSIYVSNELEVESALVYTSEQFNELYTQEGLEEFAKEAVIRYNEEQGASAQAENTEGSEKLPTALVSTKLESRTGTLIFDYKSAEDFVKFAKETEDDTNTVTDLKVGTVSDGIPDGMTFTTLAGKTAESSELTKNAETKMIVVTGSATICTQGKISFISDGVTVTDSHTAVTPEGTSCILFQ